MSFDLQVINGDLVIGSNGDLGVVYGTAQLKQALLKIVLTPVGGNPAQPWYGSLINRTLIGSVLRTDIIFAMAQAQLQNAIETLQNIQTRQVASGQKVTPDEQIAAISSININQSTVDPRLINVLVSVLNRSYGMVETSFTVQN
jgi:phage baseplate assembly protein W